MSRGPGRIERAIERLIAGQPDAAFLIDDLCWIVFPAIDAVEKKHRVSVLRATAKVISREGNWTLGQSGNRRGAPLALFNIKSRHSIAVMLAKGEQLTTSARDRDSFHNRNRSAVHRVPNVEKFRGRRIDLIQEFAGANGAGTDGGNSAQ